MIPQAEAARKSPYVGASAEIRVGDLLRDHARKGDLMHIKQSYPQVADRSPL